MKKFLMAIVIIGIAMVSCKEEDKIVVVTGVKLDKTSLSLVVGDTEKLTATVEPENAADKTVTYSTSDGSIVTVGADGSVTAVKAGSATVTVTTKDGGKTATCPVTVTDLRIDVTGVTLSETALSLKVADKKTLTATVLPENATEKSISWSTSDDSKVKVSATGEIEAMGIGTATVTVTTLDGNKTAACAVTVEAVSPGNRSPKSATITVFAGGDEEGFENGNGANARFKGTRGIAIDGDGTVYVADIGNHAVRKITPSGEVSTLIGNTDPTGEVAANGPYGLAISNGWLYVGENAGQRIRRVKLGIGNIDWPADINIFAGDPDIFTKDIAQGHANGDGTAARFAGMRGMNFDADGNLYVCDFNNRVIRKITPGGTVSDYAGVLCVACGMGSQYGPDEDILSYLRDIVYNPADGNLYVAALNRERIVKVTGKDAYATFVGAGNEVGGSDYRDGVGEQVDFARPAVIACDNQGYMFLGEQGNAMRLRFVTPNGTVSTIAAGSGTPDAGHGALLPAFEAIPQGIAVTPDGTTLYVSVGNKVMKIVLTY